MTKALPAGALALVLSCAATAQVATLQIRIPEGEGSMHAPGSRAGLVIEVIEENGTPVAGAAVSLKLPEQGPGGIFSNGLHTDVVVTDARGRAAVRGIRLNRVPGPFHIRIVAAKGGARAGTVSRQYIAEPGSGAARGPSAHGLSRRRWIAIAAMAAAAGGAVIATRGGSDPRAAPVPAPPSGPVSIGSPTIVVEKP